MGSELLLFYVFAVLAVGASLLVIGQRNPMHSVLMLIASFVALAGLYVLLDAPFAAVIQIIIYAGAILVLFLFVVMLLNAGRKEAPEGLARPTMPHGPRRAGAALAFVLALELAWALWRFGQPPIPGGVDSQPAAVVSSVRVIGRTLFTDYAFAFEVTSILILVAMVGALVLAKRKLS